MALPRSWWPARSAWPAGRPRPRPPRSEDRHLRGAAVRRTIRSCGRKAHLGHYGGGQVLLLQQCIEHVQFIVLWMAFRISSHADGHGPAGQIGNVLHEPAAVAVGAGSVRSIAADRENLRDPCRFAVPEHARQLGAALDAPCSQMRDHLVAQQAKPGRCLHGGLTPWCGRHVTVSVDPAGTCAWTLGMIGSVGMISMRRGKWFVMGSSRSGWMGLSAEDDKPGSLTG